MSFNKNKDWKGNEEEYIKECQEWLARRKAKIDQREKQFQDQYPLMSPRINRQRSEDLAAWQFEIELNEYELGGFIKDYLEDEDE